MQKRALRQELRSQLAAISPDELRARSVAACELLTTQQEYKRAEIVMLFLSGANEIDTSCLALNCWGAMKRVLAPKVSFDQRRMMPVEINSLSSGMAPNVFGIREPIQGMPIPCADIDLVVVPALAFDGQGNRLGRGRGFYDRFLSHRDFRGVICGLGFELQVVPEVPHDEHDVRIQMLVTDERVRRF